MERVSHHGRTTAYRHAGEGDARVCYVHGSGASHHVWTMQYAPQGPARPAVAVDLSGHGDSEDIHAEAGPETLRAYAADVAAVADATGADVFVGNSLGGAVLLTGVLDGTLDPAGLVLAGTGAKLAVLADLREWLDDDFERAIDFLHGADRLFHDADERLIERSKAAMYETGQRVTHRDYLSCHTFDVRDRLDEISIPALALVGESDGLTPPAYHEFLTENMPDSHYRVLDDAAHLAMIERPAAFNDAVESFLATV